MPKKRTQPYKKIEDEMDGAGFFDEVKKGYNKTKSAVKSETGQKIKKALMEDKDFMKEFNKAKKQLKYYKAGIRKSPPGKLALDILESQGVISKIENEFKGAGKKRCLYFYQMFYLIFWLFLDFFQLIHYRMISENAHHNSYFSVLIFLDDYLNIIL
jgi:hypothetical protein